MSAECSTGNIPPGYKQTEVGVIPEDWEVLPLSDISKRITDGEHLTPRRSNSGYYLLSARNILNGRISLLEVDYVGESEYRRIRQRCNPEAGDVLISCSGTIGRVAILPKGLECVMVRSAALVKPDAEKLSGLYAQYFLQFPAGQKQIFASLNQGAQANLFLNHIQGLHVALPPTLAEQESIAEAISDTDALVESLEQLIAKKRQIKQGAMQELLTGKRRLPGFKVKLGYKQTEVGVIPEDWEVKRLEEIADVIDPHPSHRAPPEVTNGIPFVGIGDLKENGDIIGNEVRMVDPSVFDEHQKRYDLKEELIGLGRVASIGKVVKIRFTGNRYTISPTLGVIRGTKVKRDYLLYALKIKTIADQFNKIMSGSTRSSVGMIVLRKLDIIFPSDSDEQNAIATILSDMDSEITILEEKLAKARQIKQGMMQELLTGKIRLI